MANNQELAVSFDAIKTNQTETTLFVGVAPAAKLLKVTSVDFYNPKLSPTDRKQGYQRPPERSRITKIGSYLISDDGFRIFPTAVLLASRIPIEYNKTQGTISLSSDNPLQIVDGQHRLAGLKYAIEEKGTKELEEFSIPFVIIETPEKLTEMTQFRIVNGTAKSVRTDLVNMILTATYADSQRADIPKKDQWRIVVSNVVDRLVKSNDSPWKDAISLPGGNGSGIIPATSFITSLRPVYVWLKEIIMDTRCKSLDDEIDYLYNVIVEYWNAVKEVVPEPFNTPDDYVLQKTPGIFSMHKLLKHLLGNMYLGRRDFSKENFGEYLKESPEITDADFWKADAKRASVYGSMKGFEELYQLISEPYKL
jgi:DGQHR domain-containing protein